MKEEVNVKACKIPRHVAIIMDGNGRWATMRGLPRSAGHREGLCRVEEIVTESLTCGVNYLTLFAFSTENWVRPAAEVKVIFSLCESLIAGKSKKLLSQGVRLRVIGDRERLPAPLQRAIRQAEEMSRHADKLELLIALSYSGRYEIVTALKRIVDECINAQRIPHNFDERYISQYLFAPDVPDPDLLIRTGMEERISNFMLWQLAYTELCFPRILFPDFNAAEYGRCLADYAGRERRFGSLENDIFLASSFAMQSTLQHTRRYLWKNKKARG